ncbi:MAG: hypothetical protein Q7S27_04380 [Nanoarchaeota archaeon]|nr:hypothetical protein [Nanoarchaeota archaeon]
MNKRGQELSIGTLVLIVLGIIVLVLLVLGFSLGWENLFGKIGIIQGSDLTTMITACKTHVATDSKTSYCEFKKVSLSDGTKEINCEYTEVKAGLGGEELEACSGAIKNSYCAEVELDEKGEPRKKDDKFIKKVNGQVKVGLKGPCPTGYASF